jgi:hypothetical protein
MRSPPISEEWTSPDGGRPHLRKWVDVLQTQPGLGSRRFSPWEFHACLEAYSEPDSEQKEKTSSPSVFRQIASLRREVDSLRRELESRLAATPSVRESRHAVANPLLDWCDTHREALLAYPDSFVAIDPKKGVVCHAATNADLAPQLSSLEPAYRATLLLTHTTLYRRRNEE